MLHGLSQGTLQAPGYLSDSLTPSPPRINFVSVSRFLTILRVTWIEAAKKERRASVLRGDSYETAHRLCGGCFLFTESLNGGSELGHQRCIGSSAVIDPVLRCRRRRWRQYSQRGPGDHLLALFQPTRRRATLVRDPERTTRSQRRLLSATWNHQAERCAGNIIFCRPSSLAGR